MSRRSEQYTPTREQYAAKQERTTASYPAIEELPEDVQQELSRVHDETDLIEEHATTDDFDNTPTGTYYRVAQNDKKRPE